MKIERRPIDDLKTERPDVAPALPAYLRVVPVFFYAVVVGGMALSGYLFVVLRNAAAAEERSKAETAANQQALARVQADREAIEKKARRANDVVGWVEGSRSLQPLVVTAIRAIDSGSSIAELGLSRAPGAASQIKLTLKLNTQGTRQLDRVLGQISSLNFRPYSPTQTQGRNEIDYTATLVYQGARAGATP